MPRRRFLSPEFFKDEDLACLPFEARLLYAGLWCYADREGRLEDRPKYLKSELFPYDRVDVQKLLDLLTSPKIPDRPSKVFIRRYMVEHRQLIDIPEFLKHQSPHHHEPESKLTPFVGTTTDIGGRSTDIVGTTTDTSDMLVERGERREDKGQRSEEQGQKTREGGQCKRPYGEFQNVKLADAELEKLETKFGKTDTIRRIENLSQYIASNPKGRKYVDHYATILQWARL